MFETSPGLPTASASASGHAYVEGRTIHVLDMAEAIQREYPAAREVQRRLGHRTVVYVPLLRHGRSIGVLSMQKFEVRPFTEQQIALLETFADQAVIAIENARLFEELEQRNRRADARRWSSRPPRPRCCASSPPRRPTSSACWTPSSRVPRGSARPTAHRLRVVDGEELVRSSAARPTRRDRRA